MQFCEQPICVQRQEVVHASPPPQSASVVQLPADVERAEEGKERKSSLHTREESPCDFAEEGLDCVELPVDFLEAAEQAGPQRMPQTI